MRVDKFLAILLENKFGPFTGVPCSVIGDLIKHIENSKSSEYYTATSEGEAMGIAAGFALCGKMPVVLLQNDGLGNAINPISSLQLFYHLPVLLTVTWRGQPQSKPDAPQHHVMGKITPGLLDLLGIPYSLLEDDETMLRKDIQLAKKYAIKEKKTYAFIVRRGYFEQPLEVESNKHSNFTGKLKRINYIQAFAKRTRENDIVVATTGYTGREMLQESTDRGIFYMAGSMGCVTSIGLGIAIEHPKNRVYILDGDGALLMKLGTLGTIGFYKPKNFIHILFDNGLYESTGGQKTVSKAVNFTQLAINSGYSYAESVNTVDEFLRFLKNCQGKEGPTMCHVKIRSGTIKGLKRPSESGPELRDRFTNYLRKLK